MEILDLRDKDVRHFDCRNDETQEGFLIRVLNSAVIENRLVEDLRIEYVLGQGLVIKSIRTKLLNLSREAENEKNKGHQE